MSTFRMLPRCGFRLLNQRSLHTTPRRLAVGVKQSRKQILARRNAADPVIQRKRISIDTPDALPPLFILETDHKAGVLKVDPHKAMEFLKHYQSLHGKSNPGWEAGICIKHGITASDVTQISISVGRCREQAQKALGRRLIDSASAMGDPAATLEIVSDAFRNNQLHSARSGPFLERLGLLAKKEKNVQAMGLLGQILYSQGKTKEAADWLQKAVGGPELPNFSGAAEALVVLGLTLEKNDKEGARKAFSKAALDLDHPSAYFYLSKHVGPEEEDKQMVYLLKAAGAGIPEACHNLGAIELSKNGDQADKKPSDRTYGYAKEWFQVAAEGGFGLSMLNLASICKSQGQTEEGLKWLERAETLPEVRDEATMILLTILAFGTFWEETSHDASLGCKTRGLQGGLTILWEPTWAMGINTDIDRMDLVHQPGLVECLQ
ncbi:hypothetical protein DSL72_001447 [Monilinia vaccinii-corymbosi]|uniref:HCP-like protein n=1 Tax=Monilinia vaccinii-corymbosi TaxID=61207 RepID=A0A8A3P9B0_9HELO|nr:hypothetical protein DSL72_001447 [Monilinia vaccinii-corymbosi]